jgi:hypothetical protein
MQCNAETQGQIPLEEQQLPPLPVTDDEAVQDPTRKRIPPPPGAASTSSQQGGRASGQRQVANTATSGAEKRTKTSGSRSSQSNGIPSHSASMSLPDCSPSSSAKDKKRLTHKPQQLSSQNRNGDRPPEPDTDRSAETTDYPGDDHLDISRAARQALQLESSPSKGKAPEAKGHVAEGHSPPQKRRKIISDALVPVSSIPDNGSVVQAGEQQSQTVIDYPPSPTTHTGPRIIIRETLSSTGTEQREGAREYPAYSLYPLQPDHSYADYSHPQAQRLYQPSNPYHHHHHDPRHMHHGSPSTPTIPVQGSSNQPYGRLNLDSSCVPMYPSVSVSDQHLPVNTPSPVPSGYGRMPPTTNSGGWSLPLYSHEPPPSLYINTQQTGYYFPDRLSSTSEHGHSGIPPSPLYETSRSHEHDISAISSISHARMDSTLNSQSEFGNSGPPLPRPLTFRPPLPQRQSPYHSFVHGPPSTTSPHYFNERTMSTTPNSRPWVQSNSLERQLSLGDPVHRRPLHENLPNSSPAESLPENRRLDHNRRYNPLSIGSIIEKSI